MHRAKFVERGSQIDHHCLCVFSWNFVCSVVSASLFSMSQQSGYSPSFKRPAEIMRMRRKRVRSDAGVLSSGLDSTGSPGQGALSAAGVRSFSPGPLFNTQNRSGGGIKRRNPFANIENTYSPKKKFVIFNDMNIEATDSSQIKSTTEKEGDEDSQEILSFSASLTDAEKLLREDVSSKVG